MEALNVNLVLIAAAVALLAASLFGAGIATGWILSHRRHLPAAAHQRLFGTP